MFENKNGQNMDLNIGSTIKNINTKEDFANWLRLFIKEVNDNPDTFDNNLKLTDFVSSIARWTEFESEGYFMHRGIELDLTPSSLQIMANMIYCNFPQAN
jgi:hypothetical protein